MNIRSFLGIADKGYAEFVREERHFTAILFHALHLDENLNKFLDVIECKHGVTNEYEPAVFYEFAFLRDAWYRIEANHVKRELIEQFLPKAALPPESFDSPLEINDHFGVAGRRSKEHIQSPGRWSLTGLNTKIECNDDFRMACFFKWTFNAKPDLVIQIRPDHCICVEAKVDSRETSYPSSKADKRIFRRRGLDHVRQTDLQSYLMTEMLGFDSDHILLSEGGREISDLFRSVSWRMIFESLSLSKLPRPMKLSLHAKFKIEI